MKKAGIITILALLALFSFSQTAVSQMEPCPIALDIRTLPSFAADGLTVILKYGGAPIAQKTIRDGEVLFDVSHLAPCGSFEAVILECEDNPACHKAVAFNPSGYTLWDITAVEIPCKPCVCDWCKDILDKCPDEIMEECLTGDYCIPCEKQGYVLPENCDICKRLTET